MAKAVEQRDVATAKNRVAELMTIWDLLQDRFKGYFAKAYRNYDYIIDEQLPTGVKKERERDKRPVMAFDILKPIIVYLAGLLEQSKLYMRAVPRNEGDEDKADMHTKLVSDYAMANCDGYKSFARATVDAAIAGTGWTNNYWDIWRDPKGKWETEAFDPFMVMYDPETLPGEFEKTCRYIMVSGFYSAQEILAIYHNMSDELRTKIKESADRLEGRKANMQNTTVGWADRLSNWWNSDNKVRGHGVADNDFYDERNGTFRVLEFHDKRTVTAKVVYSPLTRESETMTQEQYLDEKYRMNVLQKYPQGRIIDEMHEEYWISVACPGLVADEVILETPYPVQGKGFQYKPIFCYDFHPDLTRTTSLLDGVISAQDMFNSMLMALVQYVLDTINPNYVALKGSIAPEDQQAWQSKERGKILEYEGEAPEPQRPTTDANAISGVMSQMLSLKEQLSSITPTMLGMNEGGRQAQGLYAMKLQQGQVNVAKLMGSLQRTMGDVFEYCDKSLQTFMTMPRMIRMLNHEGDPQWLEVNMPTIYGVKNDVSQGDFDFQPVQTSAGPMSKQIARLEVESMLQHVPPQLIDWSEVIKLYDTPTAQKMAKYAAEKMQAGQQVGAANSQLQAGAVQAQTAERQANAHKKTIDAQSKALQTRANIMDKTGRLINDLMNPKGEA